MTSQAQILRSLRAANTPIAGVESDPVENLMESLSRTVWANNKHHERNGWEAALCKLVLSLNPNTRMIDVSEAVPYGAISLDRVGLMNTMANLGYEAKVIRSKLSDVDERLCPCLFIPDFAQNAPGVLLANGKIYHSIKETTRPVVRDSNLSGDVIFFQRIDELNDETSKFVRSGTGYSWFRAMMERFHGTIGHILVAGLFLNLMGLATPLFIMLVYDRVISSHAANVLPYLALGVSIAIIAEWALRYIRSKSLSWLGGRLDNVVSNWIFSHLMHLSPAYIERASVPSQVARIKTFESIRDFFSGSVFLSVMELPFMLIALLVIGVIAGPLVLVPLGVVFLYAALFYAVWRKVKVVIRGAAKASSARQQFSLETFEKAEAIRSNGLGNVWADKFRDLSGREALAQFQLGWLGVIGETLANALTVLAAVAVVGFGVNEVWSGGMTTGALVATMILVWRVLGPFYSLCTMIPRLEQLRNSIRQVNALMDVDTEEMTSRGLARPGRLQGRVTFAGVGLRYNENDDPVFSNLTFETRPGDIIGITGENGSGKTSILKMIKGMYMPHNGSIRLDGFDLRQINPHDLRRHIAYIPQSPDFFHGTIAENLRFGNPLATDGEIIHALGQARIQEEINAMPHGIQTIIGGTDGVHLSSSLALRLSMVRAYLQDAPIMLIDELPNSLLTDEAGRFLHDTLLRNRGKQTVFIVTYREDFLKMADVIVFLRRHMQPQAGAGPMILERLRNLQW